MPPEGWGYAEGSDFSGTCSDWLRSPGEPVLPRSPDWQEAPARQPSALNADAKSVLLLSPAFDRVHSDGSGLRTARFPGHRPRCAGTRERAPRDGTCSNLSSHARGQPSSHALCTDGTQTCSNAQWLLKEYHATKNLSLTYTPHKHTG